MRRLRLAHFFYIFAKREIIAVVKKGCKQKKEERKMKKSTITKILAGALAVAAVTGEQLPQATKRMLTSTTTALLL